MNYVSINLKSLKKFKEIVQRDLARDENGPIRKAMKQWAAIYRAALRERFVSMSRGGWAPLKQTAILGRQAGRNLTGTRRQNRAASATKILEIKIKLEEDISKTRSIEKRNKLRASAAKKITSHRDKIKKFNSRVGTSILIDTGTMFKALSKEFLGSPGQLQQNVPFGIRVGYGGPGRHPKGKATVFDIASFHQRGEGHLPKREIVVAPEPRTVSTMRSVMERAIRELSRETGNQDKP
jgi:hypothetical protein